MLLGFMLVRCQTGVRLNEVSRCREARADGLFDECAVVLLSLMLRTPDSSQSLRCFFSSFQPVKFLQGDSEQINPAK